MKFAADTSWLIALVRENDRFHVKAREQVTDADEVFVPAAIWAEFQNVFQYRFKSHAKAVEVSDRIREARNVVIGDRVDDEAIRRIWRGHPQLTYTDAAAVAEAKRLGATLLTFEERQREALQPDA